MAKKSKKRNNLQQQQHKHEKEVGTATAATDPEGVKFDKNRSNDQSSSVIFESVGDGLRKRLPHIQEREGEDDGDDAETASDETFCDNQNNNNNNNKSDDRTDDDSHNDTNNNNRRRFRPSLSKMWMKHFGPSMPAIIGRVETSLFTDTFSFLMTAKYPCCDKATKKQPQEEACWEGGKGGNNGEQQQQQQQEQQNSSAFDALEQQSSPSQRRTSVSGDRTCSFSALFGHPGCQLSSSSIKKKSSSPSSPQEAAAAAISSSTTTSTEQTTVFPSTTECMARNVTKLKNVNADSWYMPFVIGWLIVTLQVFIYIVVLLNTIQQGQPPNADTLLRLAQAFALMVALYTQSDLVDAVFMLSEGSKPFDEISTPFKFTISNLMRLVAGNLGIVASFGLVVYAPDVIDLLLNFTAIEFVATLDNSCFELASKGFLGISIEKKAKQVESFKYEYKIRRKSIYVRFFVYTFYSLIYALAFFAIVGLQASRQIGVDNEVYVQVDDSKVPSLFGISGAYIGCTGFQTRTGGRGSEHSVSERSKYTGSVAYVEASLVGNCPQLKIDSTGYEIFPANSFIYCYSLEGWVFIKQETTQPCKPSKYVVKSYNIDSKPSDSFDILTHANADWFVRRPDTQGEILLENVFVKPAHLPQYSISYNCSDGFQISGDYSVYGALGFFRFFLVPLPRSYYPIFKHEEGEEESTCFFEEFSLVYRQVFLGHFLPSAVIEDNDANFLNLTEFRNADFAQTVSITCEEPEWFLVIFDGLRWNVMEYFNLNMFVDYAKGKYEDIAKEPDSACGWKIFLKSYLRDKSWFLNETIARPMMISSPVRFLSPDDSGGPTRDLDWYRSDLVYSQGLVRTGRTSQELGWNVETSCVIRSAVCNENESLLNLDITTGRFAEETVILVQRNPSIEIQCQSTSECRSLEDYYSRLEEIGNFYDAVEVVPISEPSSVFSISERQVKDVRFKDRETRYQIESCVPTEFGSTYCIDVRFLNTFSIGLPDFDLAFNANIIRNRDDDDQATAEAVSCLLYRVCHFELTPGTFVQRIFGPNNCTFSDVEAVYPAIKSQTPFEALPRRYEITP